MNRNMNQLKYSDADIVWLEANQSIGNRIQQERNGLEVWREMLIMGLFLLILEMGIARIRRRAMN